VNFLCLHKLFLDVFNALAVNDIKRLDAVLFVATLVRNPLWATFSTWDHFFASVARAEVTFFDTISFALASLLLLMLNNWIAFLRPVCFKNLCNNSTCAMTNLLLKKLTSLLLYIKLCDRASMVQILWFYLNLYSPESCYQWRYCYNFQLISVNC